jgi:hypothetical protein
MKHYLGKLPPHLCDSLINECLQHTVTPFTGNRDLDPGHAFYEDHLKQKQLADKHGYSKGNSVEFFHYRPGTHYDKEVNKIIGKASNTTVLQSFISEIRPGKCAPWHWDIPSLTEDVNLVGYTKEQLMRCICFIDKPKPGQAFMVEDECFYMEPQGIMYRYPSVSSWHAGFNAGLSTKFLFTFTAVKKVH